MNDKVKKTEAKRREQLSPIQYAVILAPLAATSHDLMVRWLGAARWARLHQLVYVSALLAAVHFIMVVKAWPVEPMVYGLIVVALLLQRAAKRVRL